MTKLNRDCCTNCLCKRQKGSPDFVKPLPVQLLKNYTNPVMMKKKYIYGVILYVYSEEWRLTIEFLSVLSASVW